MKHLVDYVWMQLGEEPPIQVPSDQQSLTEKLAAGFHQVDEPQGHQEAQ